MDAVPIAEALELIRINEAAIVTQFQTWLTITFATIVAVFAGKDLINKQIKWAVTLLYLCASITITGLCIYFAESNALYISLLQSRGIELVSPLFAGASLFALVILGMFTTCYFIQTQSGKTHVMNVKVIK